jgi:hypothetical protein
MTRATAWWVVVLLALAGCGGKESGAAPGTQALAAQPPEPDRSVPLDRYTAVADFDTAYLLSAAFSDPPLTDDKKLNLLPGARSTTDAFSRRDLMAKELPGLNQRLDALRAQRYYKVDAREVKATTTPDGQPLSFAYWMKDPFPMQPYDLARHGFSVVCINSQSVYWPGAPRLPPSPMDDVPLVQIKPDAPRANCLFPVPDEATARHVESLRAQGTTFGWSGTVYFVAVGGPRSRVDNLIVHVVHADLTLLDASSATPVALAHASLDFPPSAGAP